jgi:hypothetical protein
MLEFWRDMSNGERVIVLVLILGFAGMPFLFIYDYATCLRGHTELTGGMDCVKVSESYSTCSPQTRFVCDERKP